MSRYVSDALRQLIAERANHRCEYCLIPEANSFYNFQVDHIISIKHGGQTKEENLAFACSLCNRSKGSDLGTVIVGESEIIRFYNPRKDDWTDHFAWEEDGLILSKTSIGEATVKIFGFNHPDSILERRLLISSGLYP